MEQPRHVQPREIELRGDTGLAGSAHTATQMAGEQAPPKAELGEAAKGEEQNRPIHAEVLGPSHLRFKW